MTTTPSSPLLRLGQEMPDGTIYAGFSPTKKRPMYLAPVSASLKSAFEAAVSYSKNLKVGGRNDFRLPDIEELKVIAENCEKSLALRHNFNTSGAFPGGYYWSSNEVSIMHAKALRMSDKYVEIDFRNQKYPVCFIR